MGDNLIGRLASGIDLLGWYDPVFFVYNVLLFAFALSIPPVITAVYIRLMRHEKLRRLEQEVPASVWEPNKAMVAGLVRTLFRWRTYFGSMALFMMVLVLGASVMLFLKPVVGADPSVRAMGLDFGKGANILMLGPYAVHLPEEYFNRLVISLAAFQYGFLGGYAHHIGQLARSYFMLDLTPHTYVDATVRIATGSLVALVLSFWLFEPGVVNEDTTLLPVVSFFVGFFPTRGLLAIEKGATAFIKVLPKSAYEAEGLSKLPGMSYAHELRLGREGLDTVENLSNASALELAVRTGFSYCQLEQWRGQAWLCGHMRDDYEPFMKRTGITSRDELSAFRDAWKPPAAGTTAAAYLAGSNEALETKVEALLILA